MLDNSSRLLSFSSELESRQKPHSSKEPSQKESDIDGGTRPDRAKGPWPHRV